MGAGHSPGGSGHTGARHRWRLALAFGLVAAFFVVELTFGLLSGSLALLSDAGHMAADVVALGAALVATRIATRKGTTERRTYGSYRAEVFVSGLTVLLMLGGPCRAETPDLVRLARENANRGVQFLDIDTRDNLGSAQSFAKKFAMPYPSLFDEGGRVLLPLTGVIPTAVIPSTVVVDREGKVAARVIGPVTYNTLNGVLADELAGGPR